MLTGDSGALEPGAVRGIAQLAASSVKGLKTENVTITDGSGTAPVAAGRRRGRRRAPAAASRPPQTHYERQLQASLDALLTQTLGPGKARVQVKADLNVDKTTRKELDGRPARPCPETQTTETEKLQGRRRDRRRRVGHGRATSPPTPPARAAAAANSNYQRKSSTKKNIVPKTVEETEVAPGAVNNLQVALVVDKSVPAADFAAIQNAIKGASGFDASRGDVFEAAQLAFAKPPAEPKAGPVPVGMLGPLKWVGLGLATLHLHVLHEPPASSAARARRSPPRAG